MRREGRARRTLKVRGQGGLQVVGARHAAGRVAGRGQGAGAAVRGGWAGGGGLRERRVGYEPVELLVHYARVGGEGRVLRKCGKAVGGRRVQTAGTKRFKF